MALNRRHRNSRATTLVEAAIVLPLVILVTFGLIEYGNLFLRLQQIENISRQAVRTAATPDATGGQVSSVITTMMTDAGLASSGYTVTMSPSDPSSATRGQTISVKITIPYANVAITNAPLIPVPATIGRKVSMSKEGP